jgi:hypothetical protein
MVLARQTGSRAVPVLVSALTRSIDREVRLAKKGGYSRRDSELVGNHRRGIVLAFKELRDTAAVPVLVRLLTLESLRAGKVERRAETSLLGVTITALQSITNYKFAAEPQRWQEVASGKLPMIAEAPKKAPAPVAKEKAAKPVPAKGKAVVAAKKPAAKAKKPVAKKPVAKAKKSNVVKLKKAPAKKTGSKKASPRKAAKVATRKPGALKRLLGVLKGAKRLAQPKRMAAKAAHRR